MLSVIAVALVGIYLAVIRLWPATFALVVLGLLTWLLPILIVALDQLPKVVPCYALGKRSQANTEAFMLDLAGRMPTPRSGEEGFRPLISTDSKKIQTPHATSTSATC